MFHLTVFAGSSGEIAPSGFTAITAFGGAELRRPTLARRIMHTQQTAQRPRSRWARLFGTDKNLVVTVFGGTEIRRPTLMEEYQALRSLVHTGAIAAADAPRLLEQISLSGDEHELYTAFTLFGATTVEAADPHKERKALDAGARAGLLTEHERSQLEGAIGSPDPAVAHVLGGLVAQPA